MKLRIHALFFLTFLSFQATAQNCNLPNNRGQCTGGNGQIAVGGANITNNNNYWSTTNTTVTGTVKVNNGGRLTVCSGVLTLNNLDMSGGTLVVLQGATVNIQNADTHTGSSEIYNYGTINFNNNVTLQGNDTRIYNHLTGVINVSAPYQLLINNNAQLINANVVNVHTLNLNVNNPNPNAVCMGVNSVLLATNVIDQTSNNNGISGLTNSCVSVSNSYNINNTSSTEALLVCIDEDATGSGSFGDATLTNQCTSCGVLQSAVNPLNLTGDANTICVGQTITLTETAGFVAFGMTYQWGTGNVGENIISGANTSSISVSPSVTTTYWVRIVETANPNNAASVTETFTVTVNNPIVSASLSQNDMVWTGRVSNNWNNVSNWLIADNGILNPAQALPTTSNNVVIPASNQTCVANNATITNSTRNARNLTIEANASLTMTGGTLRVDGNLTNQGTFTPGTATVRLGGGANQNIDMVATYNTFYNLTINKSNREAILGSNIQVTNNLTMTARNIDLNNFNINLASSGNIVNESETSRVYCTCADGFIESVANIGSSVTVQPGTMGLTLSTNGNAMGTTVIRRRHIQAGANGITGLGEDELLGITRVFDVDPQFNAADYNDDLNVDVTINFLSIEAQDIPNLAEMTVYRSQDQGASWDNVSFSSISSNSINLNGLSGFSWITAGPDDGNYLPIELMFFSAQVKANQVALHWATASEQDNESFTIERSADGFNWDIVTTLNGAGTSIHRIDYTARDQRPLSGLSYYRLKQTDFDGHFTYSNIVSVVIDTEERELVNVVNLLGQTVDINTKGMVILVFGNGESVKIINE